MQLAVYVYTQTEVLTSIGLSIYLQLTSVFWVF